MEPSQFAIGTEFFTAAGGWRCTDIGSRVIVTIKLDARDDTWYSGPPFAVEECVFDENDLQGCSTSASEWQDVVRPAPSVSGRPLGG